MRKFCVTISMLLFLISIHLTCSSFIEDSFEAEDFFSKKEIEVLQNKDFINLKTKVAEYLAKTWCSKEKTQLLMDLVAITKPSVCVEIGAFNGASVLPVAAVLKYLGQGKIYAIDSWSNKEAIKHLDSSDTTNTKWWKEQDLKHIRRNFKKLRKTWDVNNYCIVLQKSSKNAAKLVPDNIDLLHLDGNFSEIGSSFDVHYYLPKVKKKGYILLSNALISSNQKLYKEKAFKSLYEACDIIAQADFGNAILFQKR